MRKANRPGATRSASQPSVYNIGPGPGRSAPYTLGRRSRVHPSARRLARPHHRSKPRGRQNHAGQKAEAREAFAMATSSLGDPRPNATQIFIKSESGPKLDAKSGRVWTRFDIPAKPHMCLNARCAPISTAREQPCPQPAIVEPSAPHRTHSHKTVLQPVGATSRPQPLQPPVTQIKRQYLRHPPPFASPNLESHLTRSENSIRFNTVSKCSSLSARPKTPP